MAKIDASRISSDALADLRAGRGDDWAEYVS
jgi:hypothetical protein